MVFRQPPVADFRGNPCSRPRPAAGLNELPGRAACALRRTFLGSAGVPRDPASPPHYFAGYLTVYLTVLLVSPFPALTVAVTRVLRYPGKGLTS